MDSSGIASSAVLLTVVALGAAVGVASRPEPERIAFRVVHREPPGPAQIELLEAGHPPVAQAVPELVGLFGVDLASAISISCRGATDDDEMTTPEGVGCELAAQALKRLPKVDPRYLSLLVPDGPAASHADAQFG